MIANASERSPTFGDLIGKRNTNILYAFIECQTITYVYVDSCSYPVNSSSTDLTSTSSDLLKVHIGASLPVLNCPFRTVSIISCSQMIIFGSINPMKYVISSENNIYIYIYIWIESEEILIRTMREASMQGIHHGAGNDNSQPQRYQIVVFVEDDLDMISKFDAHCCQTFGYFEGL